jgi:chromosome segregation ATPase
LQGRSQDPPGNDFKHTFHVIKAFFVTPRFLYSGSDGSERRQVVVHPPEADVWGSLRSLRTTLAGATERLSQRSAEVADLRLLCVDLRAEAAAARAEAQRRELELGQVIGERDQSRGRATEAESRAEALGVQLVEASARAGAFAADLAVAQAASSEQRARAEGMSWLF